MATTTVEPEPTQEQKDAQEWYEAACKHLLRFIEQGHRFGIPLWAMRSALIAQLESERYAMIMSGRKAEEVDTEDECLRVKLRAGLPEQYEKIKKAPARGKIGSR